MAARRPANLKTHRPIFLFYARLLHRPRHRTTAAYRNNEDKGVAVGMPVTAWGNTAPTPQTIACGQKVTRT